MLQMSMTTMDFLCRMLIGAHPWMLIGSTCALMLIGACDWKLKDGHVMSRFCKCKQQQSTRPTNIASL